MVALQVAHGAERQRDSDNDSEGRAVKGAVISGRVAFERFWETRGTAFGLTLNLSVGRILGIAS